MPPRMGLHCKACNSMAAMLPQLAVLCMKLKCLMGVVQQYNAEDCTVSLSGSKRYFMMRHTLPLSWSMRPKVICPPCWQGKANFQKQMPEGTSSHVLPSSVVNQNVGLHGKCIAEIHCWVDEMIRFSPLARKMHVILVLVSGFACKKAIRFLNSLHNGTVI